MPWPRDMKAVTYVLHDSGRNCRPSIFLLSDEPTEASFRQSGQKKLRRGREEKILMGEKR